MTVEGTISVGELVDVAGGGDSSNAGWAASSVAATEVAITSSKPTTGPGASLPPIHAEVDVSRMIITINIRE